MKIPEQPTMSTKILNILIPQNHKKSDDELERIRRAAKHKCRGYLARQGFR